MSHANAVLVKHYLKILLKALQEKEQEKAAAQAEKVTNSQQSPKLRKQR